MALATLTNRITDGSGKPMLGVPVAARLYPPTGAFVSLTGDEIVDSIDTVTDANGDWTMLLEKNPDMAPANSYWLVVEQIPQANGGARLWQAIVTANTTLMAAAAAFLLPGPILPNGLTVTAGDARYKLKSALWVDAKVDFGAVGNGATDDTASIQAAFTAAAGSAPLYVPAGTYPISSPITVAADLAVMMAPGATFKWVGDDAHTMFANTVPIRLWWRGGTIDGNSHTHISLFGFGCQSTAPTGHQLLSCDAEDIEFVNVGGGAWWANYLTPSGTDPNLRVRWKNLKCTNAPTAIGLDQFETVAVDADISVQGYANGTNSAIWTSAWIKHARVVALAVDADGMTDGAVALSALLQGYTTNGPAPFFTDVDVTANGSVELGNGDFVAPVRMSDSVRLHLAGTTAVLIGDTQYDIWPNVTVDGDHRPLSGLRLQFGHVENLNVADLVLDAFNIPNTSGQPGLIVFGGLAANGSFAHFRGLTVRNAIVGTATGIIYMGTGPALTGVTVDASDISDGVGIPLFSVGGGGVAGLGTLRVHDVAGYNPRGHAGITQPSVAATGVAVPNDTGVDCSVFVAGGTVSDVAISGVSTGLTSGAFRVPAGGSITIAYTIAPTWVWFGD